MGGATLYYVHDPMCAWCWGFRPVWQDLQQRLRTHLPDAVDVVTRVGGLAPDSDQPMPPALREYVQRVWRQVAATVPGTRFNADFWRQCEPRRSTYPACRAVLAVRRLDRRLEDAMVSAIQRAYYLEAGNPADAAVLIACAVSVGLDAQVFERVFNDPARHADLASELRCVRSLGVMGFPGLVVRTPGGLVPVAPHYTDAQAMFMRIQAAVVKTP